ncbi:MAG: DUF151 domain-containing protein [Leptolyngbyaceae cyanobacterium MO_188.B28]|nr:DUF151 domain-containing protein [Leptolyngbyaceae cyanobacterium MO_188.B28]
MALARCGDKAAFSRLIERYQPLAFRFARSIVVQTDIAQDLVQEAFLQAYLSLDRLREVNHFQSWLCGIVLNVCRSYLRHRNRKVTLLSFEETMGGLQVDINPFIATSPDPMTVAEEQELYGLVLEAVNALSPKNRTATRLFYFEQLTLNEIANFLGISITAVKGRLHKARKQLKEQLSPLYMKTNANALKPQRNDAMIQVKIADIVPYPEQDNPTSYVAVLWDEKERQFLPIWVGIWSGETIGQSLNETSLPRPMTFQLMANLLNAASIELESVQIEAIREYTYCASVSLRCGDHIRQVDARPSDAIALALQMLRPIYVDQELMEQQGMKVPAEFESFPLARGFTYLKNKQAEELAKSQELRERFSKEETATSKQAERNQILMNFLLGCD